MMSMRLISALVAVSLVGCAAVGPDFKAPAAPAVATYNTQAAKQTTAAAQERLGAAQNFVAGQAVPKLYGHESRARIRNVASASSGSR